MSIESPTPGGRSEELAPVSASVVESCADSLSAPAEKNGQESTRLLSGPFLTRARVSVPGDEESDYGGRRIHSGISIVCFILIRLLHPHSTLPATVFFFIFDSPGQIGSPIADNERCLRQCWLTSVRELLPRPYPMVTLMLIAKP